MTREDRAFKHLIDRAVVERLADRLVAVVPGFDRASFVAQADQGLQGLELKARVAQVAAALHRHLDPDVPTAIHQLLASMGPPLHGTEDVTASIENWPVLHYMETWGATHPQVALPALKQMTRRFSAEFAIRPLLERDLAGTIARLLDWTGDPDPHVRRLVSEGSRPRLPWGRRLKALVADPRPSLPLLQRLYRDPEAYVRRSVANHLNDIAKDHPELAVQVAAGWWSDDAQVQRLVRHGLRGLIKAGHPGALALLGYAPPHDLDVALTLAPQQPAIGGTITIDATIHNRSPQDQALLLDTIVHFLRKSPGHSRKVFKWTERRLAAGEQLTVKKRLRLRHASIRRLYPGPHRVELQVNGQVMASAAFELLPEPGDPQR